MTSNLLKISGPSSVTSQISTVVATINVDGMSSDVTDTVVPVLYDADGNEIYASKLKMNINTVTMETSPSAQPSMTVPSVLAVIFFCTFPRSSTVTSRYCSCGYGKD